MSREVIIQRIEKSDLIDAKKELMIDLVNSKKENDFDNQANLFFDALRKIDDMHEIELVLARCPKKSGISLAVYNRLIRAAGFEVISLE